MSINLSGKRLFFCLIISWLVLGSYFLVLPLAFAFANSKDDLSFSKYYTNIESSLNKFSGRESLNPQIVKQGMVYPSIVLKNLWSEPYNKPFEKNVQIYLKNSPLLTGIGNNIDLKFKKKDITNKGLFIRYQQTINNIDVFGSTVLVVLDNDNRLKKINSAIKVLTPNITKENAISPKKALNVVRNIFYKELGLENNSKLILYNFPIIVPTYLWASFFNKDNKPLIRKFYHKEQKVIKDKPKFFKSDIKVSEAKLIYHPSGNFARLAYQIIANVPAGDIVYKCLVDAENGLLIIVRPAGLN